jgi:hypothetical protein
MNTFNRVLVVVIAAVAVAAAAAVILIAAGLLTPAQLGPFGPAVNLLAWQGQPALTGAIAALVLAGGILLLVAELRTAGRTRRLLVKHDELGAVVADVDGIEALVAREGRRVGGVREIRPRVDEKNGKILITERVAVARDANLAEVSRELQARTKSAVEHHIGRPVAAVRVNATLLDDRR